MRHCHFVTLAHSVTLVACVHTRRFDGKERQEAKARRWIGLWLPVWWWRRRRRRRGNRYPGRQAWQARSPRPCDWWHGPTRVRTCLWECVRGCVASIASSVTYVPENQSLCRGSSSPGGALRTPTITRRRSAMAGVRSDGGEAIGMDPARIVVLGTGLGKTQARGADACCWCCLPVCFGGGGVDSRWGI